VRTRVAVLPHELVELDPGGRAVARRAYPLSSHEGPAPSRKPRSYGDGQVFSEILLLFRATSVREELGGNRTIGFGALARTHLGRVGVGETAEPLHDGGAARTRGDFAQRCWGGRDGMAAIHDAARA